MLLSLPASCKLELGSHIYINNTTLGQLWEGTNAHNGEDPGGIQAQGGYSIGTWGALFHQLGYIKITTGSPTSSQFLDEGGEHGCGQAIKPQVDSNVSGTAYGLKSYLGQINPHVWSAYATDAKTWPTTAVVESDESFPNSSEARISEHTADYPGSVGFADVAYPKQASNGGYTNAVKSSALGGSAAHQILWAEIQNNGTASTEETYTDPVITSTSIANCETTKILASEEGFPYSYTGSWYGVLASDPNISADVAATDYPICQLTYDLVWHHYSNSKLYGKTTLAREIANTVRSLFEYITGSAGQTEIESHDYTRYPSGFQSHINNAVNPGIGF